MALAAHLGQPSAAALDLQAPQARISLSGAQDKAAIALFSDGVPQLPLGTSPSPTGGIRLTPFYDLMCTRIYPGLSREFAFAIGGEVLPGKLIRSHVQQMAQSMAIRLAFALGIAADMAKRVPIAMEAAIASVQTDLSPGATTLALRLQTFVRKAEVA